MIKSLSRNLDLIYEIGCLRFIQRSWKRFLNPDFQNLAEHHLRVVWIALLLSKMEKVKNTDKIMKMALMHDVAESRTGDADYLQRQYVARDENTGMKDVFADTILEDEFLPLWKEYEDKKSIESKIVKDADNLDVDFELKEQEAKGNPIRKHWRSSRNFVSRKKLYTKSAKKIWDLVQKSDPHSWHTKGRNRYTSGDWKEYKK